MNRLNAPFPTVAIWVTAAAWLGFALWLGSSPASLLPAFGVEHDSPAMRTEVRAFYGGVEAAIGISMICLWLRGDRFAALFIGGLPLAGAASGRLIGMVLDGFFAPHLAFALFELLGAVVCFSGCWMVLRYEQQERPHE